MDCASFTKLKRVFGTKLHPEKEGEHVRASSLLGLLTVATNCLGGAFAETFVLQGKPVVADKVVTIGDFKGGLKMPDFFQSVIERANSVVVDAAFYRPDRGTPFAWFEMAKEIEQFHREHYRASGLLEIYLRNNGKEPISVERLLVNGNDVTEPVKGSDIVWWRLRPNPVPAKGFGELLVRMREAPKETIALEVQTSDKKTLHLKIQPTPIPVRIESLAFEEEGKQIFAFLELVSDDGQRITRVWLDGKDVTERTRILSPNFWQNVCPIVISAPNRLTFGSFHYLRVDTDKGHKAAILFRARNDFFPLCSYGYVTPKDYASNNCNLYVCFGAMRTHELDALHSYGLKGVSAMVGEGEPRRETIGHKALWAYYLMDEPDVHDYYVEGLPHEKRVGSYAMEMVKRDQRCYTADPSVLTFLTVDLTYKPANWFVYGRIPDVLNTDPYALHVGWEMRSVFEVAETARLACAPNMMTITYQAFFHEPVGKQPEGKFPRMPFPEEVRAMMHYALAGGAKGLIAYIHCTEKSGDVISWGSQDYPDVWFEIGRVYREVELVAPILSRSHPMDIAKSLTQGVFVRALVAPEAIALVVINEHVKSLPERFVSSTVTDAEIEVSLPTWLKVKVAALVGEGKFSTMPVKLTDGGVRISLPELEVANIILLASDHELLKRLTDRYERLQASRSLAFLAAFQKEQERNARRFGLVRKIPSIFREYAVASQAQGCYGVERKSMWNPSKEKWNAWEWHDPEGKSEHSVTWQVKVTETGDFIFYICANFFGNEMNLLVFDEKGQLKGKLAVRADVEDVYGWRLRLEAPGNYKLVITPPDGKGMMGVVAKFAFLVPLVEQAKVK